MQQDLNFGQWRLNVKEKVFQTIILAIIGVLCVYIVAKCIDIISKKQTKENINEGAVNTVNFIVGEIVENSSIMTQYMMYLENHGEITEEAKKKLLSSVVTNYFESSEYSYDTDDPGYKQVVELVYDSIKTSKTTANSLEEKGSANESETQIETKEIPTDKEKNDSKETSQNLKSIVPMPKVNGTVYTLANIGSFNKVINKFYTVTSATSIYESDMPINKALKADFKIKGDNSKPQILIYHTHANEAFYNSDESDSSTTIIGVGDRLAKVLKEQFGYNVYHDKTEYDIVDGVLDRNKAYDQSETGVKKILKKYPSISLALDIHRDGVNEQTHLITTVNGKQTAKIMFFNGMSRFKETGDIGYLHNEYLFENLALSLQMKIAAEAYYPGFTRKNYLNAYKYNLDVCRQCMLVEIGAQNNTYQEAVNAAEPLAVLIHKVLGNGK